MSIELFSLLISGALFAFTGILAACLALYAWVPGFRAHVRGHTYARFYQVIAVIAGASIAGAFIYQLAYLTPVCELCWWQRIFLFPIVVIAGVAAWYKTREAHVMIAILALIGFFYAAYHYYLHFVGLVLGNPLAVPCSTGGLLPSCGDSPILTFGFVTIPFMGILVFLNILAIAFFVHQKQKHEAIN